LVFVAGFAVWQARKPVVVIAPFQMPDKASAPFSGETVANILQDRLTQIHHEIETQKTDQKLHATDMHSLGQPGVQIPAGTRNAEYTRSEVPTRFAVEVKGLSYQSLIASARAVLGTQTTISGDMILDGGSNSNFILIARTEKEGPWQSKSQPQSAKGLKQASEDLAEQILESRDPALAGVVFLNQGQVQRALAALRMASEVQPTGNKPSEILAAKLALCAGMEANEFYEAAMQCYESARNLKYGSPEEIDERFAQAQWLHGENGNRALALEAFETLANKRNYARALLGLGKAWEDLEEHEKALSVYDRFLAGGDRDPRALAIAHVGKATSLSSLGRHPEALAEFKAALEAIPGDELILVHQCVELAAAGDLDAGITGLQRIVDAHKPGATAESGSLDVAAFAAFQLGKLLEKKDDWKGASEQYRATADHRPEYFEGHNRLANSLVREGNIPGALSEFSETAKLSSSLTDRKYVEVLANQWLGNRLQSLCDYAGAASKYEAAIRLKPDCRIAHSELGHVLQQQGQVARAIEEYGKALGTKPNELDKEEWVVLTLIRLGEALRSEGPRHAQEGIAEIRAAVMIDPKSMEALLALGKALYDTRNYPEADSTFSKAIVINKNEVEAHYRLALTLHNLKREPEAIAQCGIVTKLRPDDHGYRTCPHQPVARRASTPCAPLDDHVSPRRSFTNK
jgi:tetratricopeptide (TPR) repeat protein